MPIDWFTVGAQVLNFLVLVYLLKRFLYKPILNAIETREKLIAEKLAGAEAKMADASKEQDEYRKKNEEIDQLRASAMSAMEAETNTERLRLLDEARKAADAISARRQASTRVDAQNLNLAIGHRIQQEVIAVARHALKDMSTSSLEHGVGDIFIRHVREMDGDRKRLLAEALKTSTEPAILRSAFELSIGQRSAMQQALNESLSADIRISFKVSPDLISGIEFVTNGQKISWNIADYLTSLESSVDQLLNMQTSSKPETKSDTESEPNEENIAEGAHAHGP